jgi:hypothetical protein
MKASSVSGLGITRRPVATAFLKVTGNDGCTDTIARTARLLIGFGRAALSNALAGALDRSRAGFTASSDRNICGLILGAAGRPVLGASSLSWRNKAFLFR